MSDESPSVLLNRWWDQGLRLVHVVTWDETLLLREAEALAERRAVPLWVWSAVTGLRRPDDAIGAQLSRDVETFLERALSAPAGIVVAMDLPLESLSPLARRALRDIATRKAPVLLVASSPPGYDLPDSLSQYSVSLALGGPWSPQMAHWRHGADVSLRHQAERRAVQVPGLELVEPAVDWGGVGGLHKLKAWVERRALALNPDLHLPFPRGVLLYGVPGTGKSLSVQALARSWDRPLLRLNWGGLFGRYVGQSEAQLRAALTAAEGLAPAILWIDEIDKGVGTGDSVEDAGVSQRMLGYLLTWMHEHSSPVLVACTANSLDGLPAELWRPGRFDALFFVDLPDANAREDILQIHLAAENVPDRTAFHGLGARLVNFSGADIQALVIEAEFFAAQQGRPLTPALLEEVAAEFIPWARMLPEEVERRRNWAQGRLSPA
ncbi:AAA family ATPase [Sulfobacillus harzensis]|uniref:Uncharacterized AAA domain-containing protein ycf46 n=1 Tax=Sulfobacillus harzensis TaxID=2729629 RepID=A0A7Y0Q161_9FIRM|nr:AAA family ATPase [Sulfobacillus harzensis]NMP20975.1 AAA family ATPase [Sulfobacillus harzensis]